MLLLWWLWLSWLSCCGCGDCGDGGGCGRVVVSLLLFLLLPVIGFCCCCCLLLLFVDLAAIVVFLPTLRLSCWFSSMPLLSPVLLPLRVTWYILTAVGKQIYVHHQGRALLPLLLLLLLPVLRLPC